MFFHRTIDQSGTPHNQPSKPPDLNENMERPGSTIIIILCQIMPSITIVSLRLTYSLSSEKEMLNLFLFGEVLVSIFTSCND